MLLSDFMKRKSSGMLLENSNMSVEYILTNSDQSWTVNIAFRENKRDRRDHRRVRNQELIQSPRMLSTKIFEAKPGIIPGGEKKIYCFYDDSSPISIFPSPRRRSEAPGALKKIFQNLRGFFNR